jgi:hypothetical protein
MLSARSAPATAHRIYLLLTYALSTAPMVAAGFGASRSEPRDERGTNPRNSARRLDEAEFATIPVVEVERETHQHQLRRRESTCLHLRAQLRRRPSLGPQLAEATLEGERTTDLIPNQSAHP